MNMSNNCKIEARTREPPSSIIIQIASQSKTPHLSVLLNNQNINLNGEMTVLEGRDETTQISNISNSKIKNISIPFNYHRRHY